MAEQPRRGHGPWSHTDLRLAAVEDAVNRVGWILMQVHSEKGHKVQPPEPVTRPGITARRKKRVTDEGLAYLQYLRENRGALPPGYTMVKAGG